MPTVTTPEVSYVVLSYNYENYIGQTIRSILAQTHQDFEIVVVDDASSDRSCEIVEAMGDRRIRLIRNAVNIGGAASYNRAIDAARGAWLSNLDADDWIAPQKTEIQLDAVRGRPDVAVVGSFVRFMTGDGTPLSNPRVHEAEVNVARDLNDLHHWIGRNCLCRSSTLVRRSAHMAIGLDDVTMTRAPDYELWTRFLGAGHTILLVPQRLTFYRLHAKGVTYADPAETFTEMCWTLLRNVVPKAKADEKVQTVEAAYRWIALTSRRFDLPEPSRERLLGLFLEQERPRTYEDFKRCLYHPDSGREAAGRDLLQTISVIAKEAKRPRATLALMWHRSRQLLANWLER